METLPRVPDFTKSSVEVSTEKERDPAMNQKPSYYRLSDKAQSFLFRGGSKVVSSPSLRPNCLPLTADIVSPYPISAVPFLKTSKLITHKQACEIMGCSRWTFAAHRPKMARMGVKFHQPFGRIKVDLESLLRYKKMTQTKKFLVGGGQ